MTSPLGQLLPGRGCPGTKGVLPPFRTVEGEEGLQEQQQQQQQPPLLVGSETNKPEEWNFRQRAERPYPRTVLAVFTLYNNNTTLDFAHEMKGRGASVFFTG